ncbi:beta-galactoside-binding lectin isoform X1 [Labeo rohita]|uniref:beta-galactoside-binding lectin isoform X1 n=1 Tax=Labeo rohita TaxID=84645 RepID=UPI0021E22559|nr:beta-galactoside-binding lectin isoform X1 [Labeo rohita]
MSGVLVQNMSFKAGQTLALTGVPNADSTNFAINIGHSAEDIALHMNPRFDAHGDQRTVVCNSFQDGNWCEEVREGSFPFNQNEEFQLKITFTNEEFLVTLPDGSQFHFPNCQGAEKYKYMHFEGEVRIRGIEIKWTNRLNKAT